MKLIVIWGIIGIILCGLAYLVHNKKMYDLVSGYNTSSEEEKEAKLYFLYQSDWYYIGLCWRAVFRGNASDCSDN
ncbi:MAG: DUF3784 domain-containing protein [Bacillus sp. (in: firmicutes)]